MANTPRPATCRVLDDSFRVKVYGSPRRLRELSDASGFPAHTVLSSLLHSEHVRATELTVRRLRLLAALVNFDPERIFESEAGA